MQTLPFFATPGDRLAWARQRFFHDGLRPSGLVSEAVFQSWQRCLSAGLRPDDRPAFEPVTRSRVSAALARSHALLEAAEGEFAQLDDMLAGSGCRTVLVDGQGIVLRATAPAGSAGVLDVGTRVGVDLTEGPCGSTAPGVSAWTGEACTVSGGEHFFGALQQVYCAAAPIRHRDGGVVGVLDLSIEGRPFGFDAFGIVRLAATSIENRLAIAQSPEQLLLRFQIAPGMLDTPLEGLALADGTGRLGWVNPAGRALLPADACCVESAFGLPIGRLLALGPEPARHALPSGLAVWLAATPPGRRTPAPAASPSLDDVHRRHIEATLVECRGNIAAAARRLGVSRGLLYRRLREWKQA